MPDLKRILLGPALVKTVTSRPVKARAIQFKYYESLDDTYRLREMIEANLDVKLSTSRDPQSGVGFHLQCEQFDSKLLCDGDWVVVDSFGRADVVKEKDFKVYFEPELER